MRRNASTVVVLPGPAPAEVLAAIDRSMNVALIRPGQPAGDDGDGLAAAAAALREAGRSTSAYALVPADPLAAVAAGWQAMWDLSRPAGPAAFEQAAAQVLSAWRAGWFELPDYYLVLGHAPAGPADPADARGLGRAPDSPRGSGSARASRSARASGSPRGPGSAGPAGAEAGVLPPDFYLGPLRSARPHRVAFVPATEPAQQAVGVLQALGSLRHGPWWPGLDDVLEAARTYYPGRLAEGAAAVG
jgi:hypothetical protein